MDEQPTVETIARLRLAPGDVLVLKTHGELSDVQAQRLVDRLNTVLRRAGISEGVSVCLLNNCDLTLLAAA